MKKTVRQSMKTAAVAILALVAGHGTVAGQASYAEAVAVENRTVEKAGKQVVVRMDLNLDHLDLKKQHVLRLTPVLTSADGSQEQALPPVEVYGKIRHKVEERRVALGEAPAEGTRLRRDNGTEQTVSYEASAPFRRWMMNGRLELRADARGCADCPEGSGKLHTGMVLPLSEPQYALSAFVQPQEEQVKRREETRTARLQYRQDKHDVQPVYKGNRAELDKVQASLDAVKENGDLAITGIYITGYASPEGTVAYNLALSRRRAQGFMDYVQRANPELDKALWHVDWKGEDWEGLRREVANRPGLERQADLLALINSCRGDQDACEEGIKAMVSPEAYDRILVNVYGPLRRNEYRITYDVRHFNLEEAKNLLATRPDLLSVAEIQKVADSYGRNTSDYIAALQKASETYPQNHVAMNNYALALLETEKYDAAIGLLQQHAGTDGSLLNLLGVACAKAGRYDEARSAFRQAIGAGNAQADGNLKQLEAMLDLLSE